jgi:hypothetical protein
VLGRDADATIAEGDPDGDEAVRSLATLAGRARGLRGAG